MDSVTGYDDLTGATSNADGTSKTAAEGSRTTFVLSPVFSDVSPATMCHPWSTVTRSTTEDTDAGVFPWFLSSYVIATCRRPPTSAAEKHRITGGHVGTLRNLVASLDALSDCSDTHSATNPIDGETIPSRTVTGFGGSASLARPSHLAAFPRRD
jgi:hypothetical protein